jgi:hypothetical protein
MKYVTAFLLVVICAIGLVALVLLTRDKPQYADGEATAIVKDGLHKQNTALAAPAGTDSPAGIISLIDEAQPQSVWMEEYKGRGKWLVSKADLPESGDSNLTFEEWIAKTKGWDEKRLAEYASDLSPEEQHTFQAQLRTYSSGQQDMDVIDKWYVYENSGLIEEVQD